MAKKSMQGVLIDATAQTVTDVVVERDAKGSALPSMYKLIGCETVDVAHFLDDSHDLWVDDEGLLKANQNSFFTIEKYIPWGLYAGNGLLLCSDEVGGSIDTTLKAADIEPLVKFLDRISAKIEGKRLHNNYEEHMRSLDEQD